MLGCETKKFSKICRGDRTLEAAKTTVTFTKPKLQNESRLSDRSKIFAKSLYRQLKLGGMSETEILSISTQLIDFLTEDLKSKRRATVDHGENGKDKDQS